MLVRPRPNENLAHVRGAIPNNKLQGTKTIKVETRIVIQMNLM